MSGIPRHWRLPGLGWLRVLLHVCRGAVLAQALGSDGFEMALRWVFRDIQLVGSEMSTSV